MEKKCVKGRSRVAALGIVCVLIVFGVAESSGAETLSNAVERCAQYGWNQFCFVALNVALATQINRSTDAAEGTLLDAQTTVNTTQAGQVTAVTALVSEALGQFEDLTGLRTYYDAGTDEGGVFVEAGVFRSGSEVVYTQQRVAPPSSVACPTCIITGSGSEFSPSGFSTAKFDPVMDAKGYWNPNRPGSCGCADGIAVWNLYRASPQFHQAFDYYALGMWTSVTPQGSTRFKRLIQQVKPKESPEIVEASPTGMDEYGAAGSLSIGASLSIESGAPGGGASFNIGRTWNYSKGVVGGKVLSSELHEADWISFAKSGDLYTKTTTGASSWKVPKKKAARWGTAAVVYYRK